MFFYRRESEVDRLQKSTPAFDSFSKLPPNILGFSSKTSNPTQEYYHEFSLLLECRTHGKPKVSLRIYKAYHHCFEYIILYEFLLFYFPFESF